jgi:hypothetical protein
MLDQKKLSEKIKKVIDACEKARSLKKVRAEDVDPQVAESIERIKTAREKIGEAYLSAQAERYEQEKEENRKREKEQGEKK